jgi:uroporphyrinogen-III decarboxylase
MQTEICLKNLELYRQAVGDRIVTIAVSGTDFGGQRGPIISVDCYREFFKPHHKRINDWVHEHTGWKVFFHTCGSSEAFFEDFIEAGVDIINPVQFAAAEMNLVALKKKYGNRLVFWGGGVDPQKTLPFGSPQQVREETKNNVKIMADGGGYVCATVHNIQGNTPAENIIAFFRAVNA